MKENDLKKGTTTVALTYKNGVVMSAEMRASMGTFIAHKNTKKIFKIDENIGLTMAGLVGDAQLLARLITAEVRLLQIETGQQVTINTVATLLSTILASQRFIPYWVQLSVCGIDRTGPHVFSLDAAGGSIEDKYVATGSGMMIVYGILEEYYKENLTEIESIDLAIHGIATAMKRDMASGDKITTAVISVEKGFYEIEYQKIKDIAKKYNIILT